MAANTVNETLEDDEIINIHRQYCIAHDCGFDQELILRNGIASDIAARLRGISGITAVLMTDKLDINLGDYIRGALIEAVNALAGDCATQLSQADRLQKK